VTIVIDPGRSTGVSIWEHTTPIVALLKDVKAVEAMALLTWAKGRGHTQLVVEGQHLPRDPKRINWPNLMTLILGANRWAVCGELLGFEVVRPKPAEWQGPMFKSAPAKDENGKKLTTKKKSKIVVARTYREVYRFGRDQKPEDAKPVPGAKLPHDICDSILMGRWWQLYGGGS